MSDVQTRLREWFKIHQRCIELYSCGETRWIPLKNPTGDLSLLCPLVVSQWIYFVTCQTEVHETFVRWIDEFETDHKTLCLICLIMALHLMIQKQHFIESTLFSNDLCIYIGSSDRLMIYLKDCLDLGYDTMALTCLPLERSEWITQLYQLPNLCFTVFRTTRRIKPWEIIDAMHHFSRLMTCVINLFSSTEHFPSSKFADQPCKKESLKKNTISILVEWTIPLLLQLRHKFPHYFSHYLSYPFINEIQEMYSPNPLCGWSSLIRFISVLTRYLIDQEPSLYNLANLLLNYGSQSLKIEKSRRHEAQGLCCPLLYSSIFHQDSDQVDVVRYSLFSLLLFDAFFFADPPPDDSSTKINIKLWGVVFVTFQRNSSFSAYLSILLVDALWIHIFFSDCFRLHSCIAFQQDYEFIVENFKNSLWTYEQKVTRLTLIWQNIIAPNTLKSSSFECLTVTLLRIRGLVLTHHALLHCEKNPKNDLYQMILRMDCKTSGVLDAISCGLTSSIPSRLFSSHALLVITAALMKVISCEEHNVLDLFDDCRQFEKQYIEFGLPLVSTWMSCVLFLVPQKMMEFKDNIQTIDQCVAEKTKALNMSRSFKEVQEDHELIHDIPDTLDVLKPEEKHDKASFPLLTIPCYEKAVVTTQSKMVPHQNDLNSAEEKLPKTTDKKAEATMLQLKPSKTSFLEVEEHSSNLLHIVPSVSSLVAIPPTSLRQCLERLVEPLRSDDFPISLKHPGKLKDYSTPRDHETTTETFWRLRRALLTIPCIATTDFEGSLLAPRLFHVILSSQEPLGGMVDWKVLQSNAAISLGVAFPRETLIPCVDMIFNVHLILSLRFHALECFQKIIRVLSGEDVLIGKPEAKKPVNAFIPLAELFFAEFFSRFHHFTQSQFKTCAYTDKKTDLVEHQLHYYLSQLIEIFLCIIDAARHSLFVVKMLDQLVHILDMTLPSTNTYLRRNSLRLLGKYFMVLHTKQELYASLSHSRVPWILRSLVDFKKNDPDELCRQLSAGLLKSLDLIS